MRPCSTPSTSRATLGTIGKVRSSERLGTCRVRLSFPRRRPDRSTPLRSRQVSRGSLSCSRAARNGHPICDSREATESKFVNSRDVEGVSITKCRVSRRGSKLGTDVAARWTGVRRRGGDKVAMSSGDARPKVNEQQGGGVNVSGGQRGRGRLDKASRRRLSWFISFLFFWF